MLSLFARCTFVKIKTHLNLAATTTTTTTATDGSVSCGQKCLISTYDVVGGFELLMSEHDVVSVIKEVNLTKTD